MPKNSPNICDELKFTVVCHDTADGSKYKNKAYLLAILQYILSI